MSQRITAETVLRGYCVGLFPMGHPGGRLSWHSPDPRCIFEIERFKRRRSLSQVIRRGVFETRVNTAFHEVIRACGQRDEGTWITPRIVSLYGELHRAGFAHSVESWKGGELAGGLYGVAIGAAFFGESMFHRATDASKVALAALMDRLKERDYRLVDTQWSTPHLASLGAVEIARDEYLRRLDAAIRLPRAFSDESPIVHV